MWIELLETECNPLPLLIEIENKDIDLLIQLYYLFRMVDSTP